MEAKASIPISKIVVETDGTAAGTTVTLNGQKIANLAVFYLNFYNDGLPNPLSISYSTNDPNPQPGSMNEMHSYSLIPSQADASTGVHPARASFNHFVGPEEQHGMELRGRGSNSVARQGYAQMFDGTDTNGNRPRRSN